MRKYGMKKTVITAFVLSMMGLIGCKEDNSVASEGSTKKVYLAAPFFNDTELKNVEYAEKVLAEKGLSYYSPMRRPGKGEVGTLEWAYDIYEADRSEIENADVVVALCYGNYGDSGTSWECGYAVGIGKPVILVHTDRDGDSNIMLHCGSKTNIYLDELADYDFDTMPVYEYNGKMF